MKHDWVFTYIRQLWSTSYVSVARQRWFSIKKKVIKTSLEYGEAFHELSAMRNLKSNSRFLMSPPKSCRGLQTFPTWTALTLYLQLLYIKIVNSSNVIKQNKYGQHFKLFPAYVYLKQPKKILLPIKLHCLVHEPSVHMMNYIASVSRKHICRIL